MRLAGRAAAAADMRSHACMAHGGSRHATSGPPHAGLHAAADGLASGVRGAFATPFVPAGEPPEAQLRLRGQHQQPDQTDRAAI